MHDLSHGDCLGNLYSHHLADKIVLILIDNLTAIVVITIGPSESVPSHSSDSLASRQRRLHLAVYIRLPVYLS